MSPSALPTFPRPLESYAGGAGAGLWDVLVSRVHEEPFNAVAAALFALAILHTFLAPKLTAIAHRKRAEHEARGGEAGQAGIGVEILHFLGEVEAVFGIWAVPLVVVLSLMKGWPTARDFVGHGVNFTEPMFVVVIMAIASTRPVLGLAERVMGSLAGLGGRTPLAWWLSILTIGPVLGSLITEPGAMTISALLLARHVYEMGPSPRLAYATLGLLFVNVSVGGTLTHFAAPPVLMVAGKYGWGLTFMLGHFGWKAILGITLSNLLYAFALREDFAALAVRAAARKTARIERASERSIPAWVTSLHLGFLGWTVFAAHTPVLFVAGFLFFMAFTQATAEHQNPVNLRPALLVGFFLAGLVVHGTLQQWWIAPLLGRLGAGALMIGATILTGFNDNAAITYLASLVPSFDEAHKYAVVAGAVTGGGLTVIANAPNPAGQSILSRYFGDAVSPLWLFTGALVPTLVVAGCFWFLR